MFFKCEVAGFLVPIFQSRQHVCKQSWFPASFCETPRRNSVEGHVRIYPQKGHIILLLLYREFLGLFSEKCRKMGMSVMLTPKEGHWDPKRNQKVGLLGGPVYSYFMF